MEKVALCIRITLYRSLNCTRRNLQRHRAVSPRHHGFLVCLGYLRWLNYKLCQFLSVMHYGIIKYNTRSLVVYDCGGRRYQILPRVLRCKSECNMETTVLGHRLAFPVCIAAIGMTKPGGEVAAARGLH